MAEDVIITKLKQELIAKKIEIGELKTVIADNNNIFKQLQSDIGNACKMQLAWISVGLNNDPKVGYGGGSNGQ